MKLNMSLNIQPRTVKERTAWEATQGDRLAQADLFSHVLLSFEIFYFSIIFKLGANYIFLDRYELHGDHTYALMVI